MSWLRNITLSLVCVHLLSACGFTPVHALKTDAQKEQLADIHVKVAKSREGAWLKMALEDRFSPQGEASHARYILEPSIQINSLPVIVEPTGKIQRYRIKISSPYVLRNSEDQSIVTTGTMSKLVSYNVSSSDYSTFVAPNDAIQRGINELAADYEAYFSSYFAYK